ncbi:nucleotidyltransferase domain-containing protein [Candidatus Bathyarchaeota archaeon]|nr:nucleotidyltransferase domain-containing protein [Candidatus Brockarchaeota archaeon]MBS7612543.1 nucleotidyltransferase domain-containing protein [Candidatus Bathyarchaeota archaeon]
MRVNYYQVSVDAVSKKLMEILEGVPEVKIAVLFGSVLRRNYVRDLDLGVYMDPEPDFKRFFAICGMVEEALGMPVDFVPLKKASPRLRLKALSRGKRLVVRDSRLYACLLSESLSEVMDVELKFRENVSSAEKR